MKPISWNTAWNHSWIGKLSVILFRWWRNSKVFHVYYLLVEFLQTIGKSSLTIRYFQTNQIGSSAIFRKSWIVQNVTKVLFQGIHWIHRWIEKIFSDSLTHKGVKSIQADLQINPIRYISSLVFSGLILWVILTLVFGSGFSHSEMMAILFIAFLTWFCSYLETSSFEVMKNSRLIQWFLSWPNLDDHSKGTK